MKPSADKFQARSTQSHLFSWFALLLLLVGFGLRLFDLTLQNIWWDEARNIDVALRPFWQIPTAPELDIHPPVYFWLLHGWLRTLGISMESTPEQIAFTARYVSVAAGMLGGVLLYQLVKRVANHSVAIFALLIGTLSPFWLAEAQEARMYTLGFALLTGAAVSLLKIDEVRSKNGYTANRLSQPGMSSDRSLLIHYVSFIILSALALLTHYNAVFILVAWYIWWGVVSLLGPDRWRRLRVLFLCGLAMSALVLPILPVALGQIPNYENPNLTVPSLAQYLWENWQGYLGGYAWPGGLWGRVWLLGVLVTGILGIGYWGWRGMMDDGRKTEGTTDDRRPMTDESSSGDSSSRDSSNGDPTQYASRITHHASRVTLHSFLLTWLLGGLALYYIAVVDRGAFNIRYASFVTPALYALLGIGLASLLRFLKGRLQLVFATGLVGLVLVGMVPGIRADLTDPRFFRTDTASLTAWLDEMTEPGDVVLVDQKYPFGFYYDRYAIEPEETPTGAEEATARYLFVDINTVDARLNEWAGEAERVFWIEWFESDTDPRGAVPFLLAKAGTLAGTETFQGYRVSWWQLDPPNDFLLAPNLTAQNHRWGIGLETVAVDVPESIRLSPETGGDVPVVVRWQRWGEPVNVPFKARVALYAPDGSRVAQDDRRLLNDRHLQVNEWASDDQPLNVYGVRLPPDLMPGQYSVQLLLYHEETLAPFELMDMAGNPAGFEVEIGLIEVGE